MLEVELSKLSPAELRRLSKAARARGNGLLADRVDWEIAARAEHGHGQGHAMGLAEPVATAPETPSEGLGAAGLVAAGLAAPEPRAFATLAERAAAWDVAETDTQPATYADAPARDGARTLVLVALGVAVGAGATAGGFWVAGKVAGGGSATLTPVAAEKPIGASAYMARAVPQAAPLATLSADEVEPPKARREKAASAKPARRTAPKPGKPRPAATSEPDADADATEPDRLASLYERGVRDLDAAKSKGDEPIF